MKFSEMRQSTIFQCDKCHFICTGFGYQTTEIYNKNSYFLRKLFFKSKLKDYFHATLHQKFNHSGVQCSEKLKVRINGH